MERFRRALKRMIGNVINLIGYQEYGYPAFITTIHLDVSARPSR